MSTFEAGQESVPTDKQSNRVSLDDPLSEVRMSGYVRQITAQNDKPMSTYGFPSVELIHPSPELMSENDPKSTSIDEKIQQQAIKSVESHMTPQERKQLADDQKQYDQQMADWEKKSKAYWKAIEPRLEIKPLGDHSDEDNAPKPPEMPASVKAYNEKVQKEVEARQAKILKSLGS